MYPDFWRGLNTLTLYLLSLYGIGVAGIMLAWAVDGGRAVALLTILAGVAVLALLRVLAKREGEGR